MFLQDLHAQTGGFHTSVTLHNSDTKSTEFLTTTTSLEPKVTVTFKSTTDVPANTLLLTWLLLLDRQPDNYLHNFEWGYVTPHNPEVLLPIGGVASSATGFHLPQDQTIPDIIKQVNEQLRLELDCEVPTLNSYTIIFFRNRSSSNLSFRLDISPLENQLVLQAQWQQDTIMQSRIENHLDVFAEIFTAVMESLKNPFVDIFGPVPSELDQIWAWNAQLPPCIDECMHDIISRLAAATPSSPAVSAWDGELSYSRLDELSTMLATRLRSCGVEIGSLVPLCFEKSRWTVVAVLAVMKAGGTFVLMDPSQPVGRLKAIVAQTRAGLILSSTLQEHLASLTSPASQIFVVSEETLHELANNEQPSRLLLVPTETPMYIIFTSGTTGVPKGVVITHKNYTSGALPRADAVGYTEGLRVFEFASYAFDVSIDCILCTLAKGGCICVPSDESRMNNLSGAIRSSKAKMAHMTPSVARTLDPDIIPSLEVLGLGGESVSAGDAMRWSRQTKLVIAYGPSECTVGCTINNDVGDDKKSYTNIGKGVGGITWIVDPVDHNRLAPVGSVGELLVEGPIVGVGYLNEPERTSQVFIEDPAWLLERNKTQPGRRGRLYKTGDLVRYDPDGSGGIVFVGRKDQQVKLRGQRVELVEIEHHLRDVLPASIKVAAEVVTPEGYDPILVVFVATPTLQTDGGSPLLSPELRKALAHADSCLEVGLPRYMVPTAYIPLYEIPSLVSGKTDRKKLREIGRTMSREEIFSSKLTSNDDWPETATEQALAGLWHQVLGYSSDILLGHNFFALGGDSLKAMRLVALAHTAGISLTVATIFRNPSLRDMSAAGQHLDPEAGLMRQEVSAFTLLDEDWPLHLACADVAKVCDIGVSAVEDIYPCTPLQEALMALSAKIKHAYVAQRVLELVDEEASRKFREAVEQAVAESPILRTRIVQIPRRGLMQVVVRETLSWGTASTLQGYLDLDHSKEMELGRPLVRCGTVAMKDNGKFYFVLTIHHSLYDGWSMPLIVDRINRAYQGLPSKPFTPFKEFISALKPTDRQASGKYWTEQLQGTHKRQFPLLPWEGYQTQSDSLLEHFVQLESPPISNTTLATIIRGAWALVAAKYAGTTDVVFGETLTGRSAAVPGVDTIEAPMITTVPVRIKIDQKVTVKNYLQAIQDQMISQIPYEHMGLQHIRTLNNDTVRACELRTGLVLHPSDTTKPLTSTNLPADGLVPASDSEAATEALKFNTYGLMLVCTLEKNGFLIMASFDSNMIDTVTMENVLKQFSLVTCQLHREMDMSLGDLQYLTDADREALSRLSKTAVPEVGDPPWGQASGVWIVDPVNSERLLPRGAIGEVIVETSEDMNLPVLEPPSWIIRGSTSDATPQYRLFRTNKFAKIDEHGSLILLDDVELPLLKQQEESPRNTVLSATSAKQKILRSIWSRILQVDEQIISLSDSFFRLGGDSISAMKLVSEARQAGFRLTVAEIFGNRTLYQMSQTLHVDVTPEASECILTKESKPYQSLHVQDGRDFASEVIRPLLHDPSWKIADVLPTRPMQEIAIRGTIQLPRYSMRYEILHFEAAVDLKRLRNACQELVSRTEILRTVFVETNGKYYGIMLEDLTVLLVEYDIEDGIEDFAEKLCQVDVQARIPPGSAFVKFFLVQDQSGRSSLVFRISHAQYDEICLPLMIRRLSAFYVGRAGANSVPFSAFVDHVIHDIIPPATEYWRDLLRDSSLTILRPDIPIVSRTHHAIRKSVNIAARSRDITIATLPTAAWALTLFRRLGLRDLVFGEVASGRNVALPSADAIIGPCWQYVPVRVQLQAGWTGADLLAAVQHQHIASSQFEGMGLSEILRECTDWPADTEWFDSVVHQDVEHVETLCFGEVKCKTQTVYVHEEPLREWKIQAFQSGDTLTLEIVTFESWSVFAMALLDDLMASLEALVKRPGKVICKG